jgi:hypothetical protein
VGEDDEGKILCEKPLGEGEVGRDLEAVR